MKTMGTFSQIFLMMPSQEAAQCLLVLTREEKLALLQAVKTNRTSALPAAVEASQLPSLAVFRHFERKIGQTLLKLAELVGDKEVGSLLSQWAAADPLILQQLRDHVFFFEEVVYLSDQAVQRLFRTHKLSPLMLVDSSQEVREKLVSNVSRRVAQEIRGDFTRLQDALRLNPDVYRVKGRFCQLVMQLQATGEIEMVEFPLPEIAVKACERDVRIIAAQLLRMGCEDQHRFLQEHMDQKMLKMLFDSPLGEEVKNLLLAMSSERFRAQLDRLCTEVPPRLTLDTLQRIAACRQWAEEAGGK